MTNKILAKRYANAFIDFTKKSIGTQKALKDLLDLKNKIMRNNPDFLAFLELPQMSFVSKCEFIDKVLGSDFSYEIKQFLKMLVQKSRIDAINDIIEYARITYLYGDRKEVLLKSSYPLSDQQIMSIEEKIENKFNKKFKFFIELDANLLGGVKVIIDDNTIVDGSVRKRLDDLKEQLKKVRV